MSQPTYQEMSEVYNAVVGVSTFKKLMEKDNKNFTAVVYPNTGHAFFNDTNARMYNTDAAADAWSKTLKFLQEHLG